MVVVMSRNAKLAGLILDYSKVTVKGRFLRCLDVANIAEYERLRVEILRLLQEERERKKLSRYAVAQKSGVSQAMLSLVERGMRNPTLELVLRIADGIGADLPAIIKKAKAKR